VIGIYLSELQKIKKLRIPSFRETIIDKSAKFNSLIRYIFQTFLTECRYQNHQHKT